MKRQSFLILLEAVPAGEPVIGTGKDYWGFSIYSGKGSDERLACGSADDLATCMDMAAEMVEIESILGERGESE